MSTFAKIRWEIYMPGVRHSRKIWRPILKWNEYPGSCEKWIQYCPLMITVCHRRSKRLSSCCLMYRDHSLSVAKRSMASFTISTQSSLRSKFMSAEISWTSGGKVRRPAWRLFRRNSRLQREGERVEKLEATESNREMTISWQGSLASNLNPQSQANSRLLIYTEAFFHPLFEPLELFCIYSQKYMSISNGFSLTTTTQ